MKTRKIIILEENEEKIISDFTDLLQKISKEAEDGAILKHTSSLEVVTHYLSKIVLKDNLKLDEKITEVFNEVFSGKRNFSEAFDESTIMDEKIKKKKNDNQKYRDDDVEEIKNEKHLTKSYR